MSASEYYSHTTYPANGVLGSASAMRTELESIETGISAKLPDLSGNGGKIVAVNAGATALEALTTTGTGSAVRASSPTLVTPTLGVATATSLNKWTFTAPATSCTFTLLDGKTFTVNNTLTFAGTDGSTLNIGTGGTLGTAAFVDTTGFATLAFKTVSVSGQSDVVADAAADTLTLAAGSNITITTDAATDTVTLAAPATSSQAQMEAASSNSVMATPGTINWHPGVAKAWLQCDVAGTVDVSHNITSITDTGTGILTVTIATDFSSTNYAVIPSNEYAGPAYVNVTSKTAGSIVLHCHDSAGNLVDPVKWHVACLGDQA